jgi:hypothetical protein
VAAEGVFHPGVAGGAHDRGPRVGDVVGALEPDQLADHLPVARHPDLGRAEVALQVAGCVLCPVDDDLPQFVGVPGRPRGVAGLGDVLGRTHERRQARPGRVDHGTREGLGSCLHRCRYVLHERCSIRLSVGVPGPSQQLKGDRTGRLIHRCGQGCGWLTAGCTTCKARGLSMDAVVHRFGGTEQEWLTRASHPARTHRGTSRPPRGCSARPRRGTSPTAGSTRGSRPGGRGSQEPEGAAPGGVP